MLSSDCRQIVFDPELACRTGTETTTPLAPPAYSLDVDRRNALSRLTTCHAMTSERPFTTGHAIGVPGVGRDLWVPYELRAHTRGSVSPPLGVDPALAAAPRQHILQPSRHECSALLPTALGFSSTHAASRTDVKNLSRAEIGGSAWRLLTSLYMLHMCPMYSSPSCIQAFLSLDLAHHHQSAGKRCQQTPHHALNGRKPKLLFAWADLRLDSLTANAFLP